MQKSTGYTSFLVRLWREPPALVEPPATCPEVPPAHRPEAVEGLDEGAGHEWLAQVEHIPTGEQQYFASLEDLFAFIREQVAGSPQEAHPGR